MPHTSGVEKTANYWRGVAFTAGAGVCWSLGGIIVRSVEVGDWEIVFWRSALMAATLALYLLARDGRRVAAGFARIGGVGLIVAVLYAASFILVVTSLTRTSVAHTYIIMSAAPMVAALLAWPILGEPMRFRTWLAMAVTAGGITLIFADRLEGGALVGDALAAVLAVVLGAIAVTLRRARAADMVPAFCLAGIGTAVIAFPLVPSFAIGFRDFVLLAIMGAVQLGLAVVLFAHGAKHLPATEVALIALLEPVLAPVWVWIGIGETPSPFALTGGALVLGALAGHSLMGARQFKPPIGMA
jgi:drug/metabolite transporter (DMT)-like permease